MVMNKHSVGYDAYLLLAILSVMVMVLNFSKSEAISQTRQGSTVYLAKIELLDLGEFFREPHIEKVLFVVWEKNKWNGYLFTTYHDYTVDASGPLLNSYFKEKGIEPKDIIAIVHNHINPSGFSFIPGNHAFYHYFKNRGFNGKFAIYYNFNKNVRFKK